jgi:hypothetical protein
MRFMEGSNYKFITKILLFQASGKTVRYSDLLNLFQHDVKRGSTGLSVVPKLRPVHLSPNSFQKMNVKLAVQVVNFVYFCINTY